MGMINTTQDILGYHFVPFDSIHCPGNYLKVDENNEIINSTITVDNIYQFNEEYLNASEEERIEKGLTNGITASSIYNVLECLFYNPTDTSPNPQYYYYAFNPDYERVKVEEGAEIKKDGTVYYYYDTISKAYRLANAATYNNEDADGNSTDSTAYYTRINRWELKELKFESEDSIYALIAAIHRLLGT
jgi:hypothetical protein